MKDLLLVIIGYMSIQVYMSDKIHDMKLHNWRMLDVISDVTAVLPALNGTTQVDGHILAGNGSNIFMILFIFLQIF